MCVCIVCAYEKIHIQPHYLWVVQTDQLLSVMLKFSVSTWMTHMINAKRHLLCGDRVTAAFWVSHRSNAERIAINGPNVAHHLSCFLQTLLFCNRREPYNAHTISADLRFLLSLNFWSSPVCGPPKHKKKPKYKPLNQIKFPCALIWRPKCDPPPHTQKNRPGWQ